jgi:hypothetical protein
MFNKKPNKSIARAVIIKSQSSDDTQFMECTANYEVSVRYPDKNIRIECFPEDNPGSDMGKIMTGKSDAYRPLSFRAQLPDRLERHRVLASTGLQKERQNDDLFRDVRRHRVSGVHHVHRRSLRAQEALGAECGAGCRSPCARRLAFAL